MLIALGPSVCMAHLRLGKGINAWHMVGTIGEKKLLYGEPGTNRAQARFPQTSLKVPLQKPMDLSLVSSTSLGIASSLCRSPRENQHLGHSNRLRVIPTSKLGPASQKDQVSYLYHTADLGSTYCFLWVMGLGCDMGLTPQLGTVARVPRNPAGIARV